MSDVSILYRNSEITSLSNTGIKTLETGGKYCDSDIEIQYTKPAAPAPSLQAKSNISPTLSSQTITADNGYDGLSSVQINAMPSGSATTPATTITANPSISVNLFGEITASVSKSQKVTPTVSPGYVSSGTYGTVTVSGSSTEQLTTKTAQTYTPTTTNQTIAAGQYLTGAQTILGDANLLAENIKKDVSIFSIVGSYEGGGGGGVKTAYVDGVEASGILYYTDANMQVKSGRLISGEYLPVGTLIFVYDDGPATPFFPTGAEYVAGYTVRNEMFTIYKVTG